eukprot:scaffold29341_cov57-Phaeocystis_antarctica.AAC.2
MQRRGAHAPVGELGVEGARPVGDEVVGRVLPQHQDVDPRELSTLLDGVNAHAHQRRLDRRAQPRRAGAADEHADRAVRGGAQLPVLIEFRHERLGAVRHLRDESRLEHRVEGGPPIRVVRHTAGAPQRVVGGDGVEHLWAGRWRRGRWR